MESYTARLETMVEERNQLLLEEEKNFELLLYGMVPPYVILSILYGSPVCYLVTTLWHGSSKPPL